MAAPKGSPKHGGRKKGVPNKATADVKAYALKFTQEAIEGLVAIGQDAQQPAAARVSAWDKVLDRAIGKAVQGVELTGKDGEPIKAILATMTAKEAAEAYAGTVNGNG